MGRGYHRGGRGGRGGRNKRKGRDSRHSTPSKRQKQNSSEAYPPGKRDDHKQWLDDKPKETIQDESSSGSESEEEAPNAYQELISSIAPATREDSNDEDIEDDSDLENPEEDGEEEEDEDRELDQLETIDENGNEDSGEDDAEEGEEEESGDDEEGEDEVAESEEEEEEEDKIENGDNGDAEIKETDPFMLQFEHELPEELVERLGGNEPWIKEEIALPLLKKGVLSVPDKVTQKIPNFKEKDLRKLHVKERLCNHIVDANKDNLEEEDDRSLSPLQQDLFAVMNNYQDLYYSERDHRNGEEIRVAYCLHALNHILKTRSQIIKHNSQLKEKKDDLSDDYRDQGLTRPKVLIVLPFRESAHRVVTIFENLLVPNSANLIGNNKRFQTEYGSTEDDSNKGNKPEDFEGTFAGNIDDHFRIGLSVAKKALKLYVKFYSADIILTSPLGLRTIIGAEGEKDRDFDFLSSIELLIFDQADIFLMQNWDHIIQFMKYMHLQPKESHDVDFSRVRMWTLNGWSKFYRQTLLFSGITSPEINALFNKHCHNAAGKVVIPRSPSRGAICQIVIQLPQVFHRISASSYKELSDERFNLFTKKILPQHEDAMMSQTLVFIPSYFDFVRVRNYLHKEKFDFRPICEYTDEKLISINRSRFFHGKVYFLLYTERIHFYRRFRLRGIKHIVFYELPHYAHFYSEICNMLQDPRRPNQNDNMTCTALYSKYDAQRLAETVGKERATQMLNSEKVVHMFVTGE